MKTFQKNIFEKKKVLFLILLLPFFYQLLNPPTNRESNPESNQPRSVTSLNHFSELITFYGSFSTVTFFYGCFSEDEIENEIEDVITENIEEIVNEELPPLIQEALRQQLEASKISELHKMCKNYGLDTSTQRQEMIQKILVHRATTTT